MPYFIKWNMMKGKGKTKEAKEKEDYNRVQYNKSPAYLLAGQNSLLPLTIIDNERTSPIFIKGTIDTIRKSQCKKREKKVS